MTGELPPAVRAAVEQEERTERALERAVAPLPGTEPDPEPRSSAEAFTARMAEQRRAEDEHEARVTRAMFENPTASTVENDPLRAIAREQLAGRRRRRGRVP